MLRIQAIDHWVVLADDVERSVAWYRDKLGLEPLRYDEWRNGEAPFPSLRVNEGTIVDVMQRRGERTGENIDHVCLVVEPCDLDAIVDSGAFDVQTGPVTRWGARGDAMSIYVRDPDGNVVELRHYGGAR